MKLVVIESPYAGDIEKHLRYARRCMTDSLTQYKEYPIASHLLYMQSGILDDNVPEERALGIAAGLAWATKADYAVFYTDFGWSKGMLAAKEKYDAEGFPYTERKMGE